MTTQPQTDLQQAVDNVQPSDLKDNLTPDNTNTNIPENLTKNETTPFIDESVRTDK